jgi:hypothetical protein
MSEIWAVVSVRRARYPAVVESIMSRKVDVAWPPRSPDLTPMDFSLWRHAKEHVLSVPPTTIDDLAVKLQAAVTMVHANMLKCVRMP